MDGDAGSMNVDVEVSIDTTALQEQFAAARTIEEGKPTITLTLDGGAA